MAVSFRQKWDSGRAGGYCAGYYGTAMNVEGMPWYVKVKPLYPERKEPIPPLSRKELLRLTFSALAAALAVGLIFLTAFYLFIMFCVRIWFK
jgi:hypothetical protein